MAAKEKIEQTRQALGEAEKALEGFGAVKVRPDGIPPAWGSHHRRRGRADQREGEAFTNVEQLKAELIVWRYASQALASGLD